jgi:hypothetical protein
LLLDSDRVASSTCRVEIRAEFVRAVRAAGSLAAIKKGGNIIALATWPES